MAPELNIVRAAHSRAEPGRAGMLYRDLIPDRLNGRWIASQITIPGAGPVGDWVHHHHVGVQFLYCRRGEAKVVYEDQGEPLDFTVGDLILQPPHIRHEVLWASAGFEVVEIASPALHETAADAGMSLPNRRGDPDRRWDGQSFLHDRGVEARWAPAAFGAARQTQLRAASAGRADASILRLGAGAALDLGQAGVELRFGFVLQGTGRLSCEGEHDLADADAFVLPAGAAARIIGAEKGLELLWATAPAS